MAHGRHKVWQVAQAGRGGDSDPNQLVYSIEKDAVAVTHDRGFARGHQSMPIGRVIILACLEMDAADTLGQVLDLLVPMLERCPDVYVTVSRDSRGVAQIRTN